MQLTTTVNFKQFLDKFKQNEKIVLSAIGKTFQATVEETSRRIIDRTPVGDPTLWKWPAPRNYKPGTLKASWELSFKGNLRTMANVIATINNPQPYAQRVEYGWSTQAPRGVVRVTLLEVNSILARYVAEYKVR